MSQRLLSAQAARLSAGASTTALASAPLVTAPAAAAAAPAAAAAASSEGEVVDVVTLADARAAILHAEGAAATAERNRFCAVLNSASGQANVPLATFMLENNPTASADAIIAHLDKQPKPEAAAAPAATAAAPVITTPLANTPIITVAPTANTGQEEPDPKHAEKVWEAAAASTGPGMGAGAGNLAPGVPRTGN